MDKRDFEFVWSFRVPYVHIWRLLTPVPLSGSGTNSEPAQTISLSHDMCVVANAKSWWENEDGEIGWWKYDVTHGRNISGEARGPKTNKGSNGMPDLSDYVEG